MDGALGLNSFTDKFPFEAFVIPLYRPLDTSTADISKLSTVYTVYSLKFLFDTTNAIFFRIPLKIKDIQHRRVRH